MHHVCSRSCMIMTMRLPPSSSPAPTLQVLPGSTEPAVLRSALQTSLPHAPPLEEQPVQYPAMLYTTVGRLLSPPRRPDADGMPGMVSEDCLAL